MLRRKLQFLIVLGVIFSSLTGLLGVRTRTFAETNTKVLIDETFLNVSYETELTEEGNVFRIKMKREADSEQKKSRLKLKILTESDQVIEYPVIDGMEKKDDWLNEKEFTSSANYELEIVLPKKEKKLKLFIELNEQNEQNKNGSDTDILGLAEPMLLEMDKTDSSKNSKKESASSSASDADSPTVSSYSLYSEQNTLSPLSGITTSSLARGSSYTNKAPSYKTDNGEYPQYSWQPTGQTNVINHQGGKDNAAANVWDGVQSWNTSTDNYKNSYIYYGVGEKAQGDIALRKYATETAKEDEFNVRLNVRGDSLTKPGVDVMFVLDNSASMTFTESTYLISGKQRKEVSVESLKKVINQFKSNVPDNLGYLKIGGVVFGSEIISTSNLSARYADWDQLVSKYQSASTQSHQTYTQGGLIEAQKKLLATNDGRRKVIFLLTDGAPNSSRKPTAGKSDPAIFPSQVRITNYIASEAGDPLQSNGSTSLYVLSNLNPPIMDRTFTITNAGGGTPLKINSHLDMANSQAADLRDAGIEIQAIAMGTYGGPLEYHSPADLIKGLYKMTTQRSNTTGSSEKDYYFYQAKDLKDFDDSFQDWFESTLTTVEHGVIEDPLGDMVELVETPTVKDVSLKNGVGTKAIDADRMAIVDSSNSRKVKVTNINLYGNQEIEINYKVRLKTEDSSFVSGKWYPANGKTTLQVSPDRTTDILDFGVPSVRAVNEDFVIPVKKVWSNDANNRWGLRQEVRAVLQRKDGTQWVDLHEVSLNEKNTWTNQFPAVSGNSTIEYRVIERIGDKNRVPSYANPTYSQESFTSSNLDSAGITITNRLLTTDFSFKKVMENEQPFTVSDEKRPKFTFTETRKNLEVAKDVAPDNEGVVKFTNLPAGIYRVSETFVPEGFKKCDDFTVVVAERTDGTGVIATSTIKTIVNELKEFKLTVIKTNDQGTEIEGAAFRLRNSSGTYNKTISTGSTFTFTGLEPGNYFLKEVTAPDNYIGLDKEVAISIFDNALASIETHPLLTSSVDLNSTENTITVKVKNKRQFGALPKTGSFGNRYFILASSICLVIGSGLGAIYWYVDRRRG
ncbi:SpaA isopeptide-forming pilin-related protein [Enterococcus avium]|uniref:SpaA isopeptide-forming pilin-related protein n=1 Tax=Enterococcus avium TaxID=33945 RepID=UPI00116D9F3B|nr:SpaA isopeptide-forming pilin-related protein [Enterococcus avium]MDT2381312.1 SpaA isopeptide-forming pilin-related protein [Enterococcus avium]MDT2387682.1 SpaA isopeptide-forming pilin-related protein [Enterococcus avium]MDT2496959.1 SpaA isopeptide-forming pilin-related protein [Enterococcus avium]VUW94301.1 Cna protein B-type domain protein [Enterococcus avium]